MTEAAAFAAWAGAATIVLSDGRRGLALGLALIAGGLAAVAWGSGDWLGGSLLLAGGAASAVLRLRSGRPGWGFMPPGSTPRLILASVGGLVALWIAASVTTGADAPLRFASLVVIGMMGARALEGKDSAASLTSAAGLALALGAASAMAPSAPGFAPSLFAGLIAAAVSWLPEASRRGA